MSFLEFTSDRRAHVPAVDPHDLARNVAGCTAIQEDQNGCLFSGAGNAAQRLGYVVEESLPVRRAQLIEDRGFGDPGAGAVDADSLGAEAGNISHGVKDDRLFGQLVSTTGQRIGMVTTPVDALLHRRGV